MGDANPDDAGAGAESVGGSGGDDEAGAVEAVGSVGGVDDVEPTNLIVEMVIDRELVDLTIDRLWVGGTTGIEERELDGQADAVMLRAGFESTEAADATMTTIGTDAQSTNRVVPDGSELEQANEFARPVKIGEHLVVQPARATPSAAPTAHGVKGETPRAPLITIDAGRAFGHGGHPTTRLALEAIADILSEAKSGVRSTLDVGCGSGVLAIAALTLGAKTAMGVDIAADAVAATHANAKANSVEGRLTVVHGELATTNGQFPLVVANLEAPLLETLAEDLMDRVEPGGTLVLGGLLEPRWASLAEYFSRLRQLRAPVLDGWIGPVLEPPRP